MWLGYIRRFVETTQDADSHVVVPSKLRRELGERFVSLELDQSRPAWAAGGGGKELLGSSTMSERMFAVGLEGSKGPPAERADPSVLLPPVSKSEPVASRQGRRHSEPLRAWRVELGRTAHYRRHSIGSDGPSEELLLSCAQGHLVDRNVLPMSASKTSHARAAFGLRTLSSDMVRRELDSSRSSSSSGFTGGSPRTS